MTDATVRALIQEIRTMQKELCRVRDDNRELRQRIKNNDVHSVQTERLQTAMYSLGISMNAVKQLAAGTKTSINGNDWRLVLRAAKSDLAHLGLTIEQALETT